MIIVIILILLCISCTPSDDAIISLAAKNDVLSGYNWLIKTYRSYYFRCPENKDSLYQFAISFSEGTDMDDMSQITYLDYANSLNNDNVYFCALNDTCYLYNSKTGVGCVEYCGFSKLINNLENPSERIILPRFFDKEGKPLFIDSHGLERRIQLLTRLFPGHLIISFNYGPFSKSIRYRELFSYSSGTISPVMSGVNYNREDVKWVINDVYLDLEEESLSSEYQNCLLQIMKEWCDSFPEIDSIVFPINYVCGVKDNERVYLEDYSLEERDALISSISVYDLLDFDDLRSAIQCSHIAAFYEFNNCIKKRDQIIDGKLVYYWLMEWPSFVLNYLEYDSNLRNDYLQLLSAFFIEKPEEYEPFKNCIKFNSSSSDFVDDLDIMMMQSKCTLLSTSVQ